MVEKSPNQKRHMENLSILHGVFYRGIYFHQGVAQISREKIEKRKDRISQKGVIYRMRERIGQRE